MGMDDVDAFGLDQFAQMKDFAQSSHAPGGMNRAGNKLRPSFQMQAIRNNEDPMTLVNEGFSQTDGVGFGPGQVCLRQKVDNSHAQVISLEYRRGNAMKTRTVLGVVVIIFAQIALAEEFFKPAAELPKAAGAPAAAAPAAVAAPVKAEVPEEKLDIPDTGGARAKASLKSYSGVVNVIRQGDRVEVVFRNGDIYFLPHGSKQAGIFKALSESEQTGKAVSIEYDSRSGVIEAVGGGGGGLEKK